MTDLRYSLCSLLFLCAGLVGNSSFSFADEVEGLVTTGILISDGDNAALYGGAVVAVGGVLQFDRPGSVWCIAAGGGKWKKLPLQEGRIYLLDENCIPQLTKDGEFSVKTTSKREHQLWSKEGGNGEIVATVPKGKRVEVLTPAKDWKDWHKVRLVDDGTKVGWVRGGDGWDQLAFEDNRKEPASNTALDAEEDEKPEISPTEQIVDSIAAEWALKSALNLQQVARDDIIELAVAAQSGTVEQQMARCLLMAETPKARQVLAKLREAKRKHRSENVRLLQITADTEFLKVTAGDTIRALVDIDRVRTDLVAKTSSLDTMDAKLAAAVVRAEQASNNAMTPELAKALVKYHVARAATLVKEIQVAKNDSEVFMNDAISQSRAAFLAEATSLLEKASTAELVASRKKVKKLLTEAVASDLAATKAFAHANAIATLAATEQLSKSRRSVEARIKDAWNK